MSIRLRVPEIPLTEIVSYGYRQSLRMRHVGVLQARVRHTQLPTRAKREDSYGSQTWGEDVNHSEGLFCMSLFVALLVESILKSERPILPALLSNRMEVWDMQE